MAFQIGLLIKAMIAVQLQLHMAHTHRAQPLTDSQVAVQTVVHDRPPSRALITHSYHIYQDYYVVWPLLACVVGFTYMAFTSHDSMNP